MAEKHDILDCSVNYENMLPGALFKNFNTRDTA